MAAAAVSQLAPAIARKAATAAASAYLPICLATGSIALADILYHTFCRDEVDKAECMLISLDNLLIIAGDIIHFQALSNNISIEKSPLKYPKIGILMCCGHFCALHILVKMQYCTS
ncbi:hypothetical protein DINM_004309 [Dirofilaria immitis]|nr:hypothetical protein [Dirofilaria immitis]